jgi:hypothetical protein
MNATLTAPQYCSPLYSRVWFQLTLMFAAAFILATQIHPAMTEFQSRKPDSGDPLASILGDGRKLFANHFYVKADVYFHSGYYPTIFDNRESHQTAHMAEDAGVAEGRNTGDEEHFLGKPSDWIDAHSRKHFPSVHTHLGEDSPDGRKNAEREILPWLKFSAKLDPNKIETYTVAAYWLRRTGAELEAEAFLREGLRANPDSVEILFELGRCRWDAKDIERARNLWALAWRRWQQQELPKPVEAQNRFIAAAILMNLARLEHAAGDINQCVRCLETLLPLKQNPDEIRKRIADVKAGLPLTAE